MKLLLLTLYFPPEVGAPQNRLFELAVRLKKKGAEVIILTAMPNYPQMEIYKGYKNKFRHYEEMEGLKVYRSWIYTKKTKSIFFRLLNYLSFTWSSFWSGWFRTGKFDYILCESPPLFLGISAFLLSKLKGSKLIFNVSDLWPESAEKLGLVKNKLLLDLAYRLESFLYKNSELITCQTQGIVKNISERFPGKKTYWLPNGVDFNHYNFLKTKSSWRKEKGFCENDFILLYAGIIGHAQGLEVVLKAADKIHKNEQIKFVLLGNGPEKSKLQALKENRKLDNVFFYDAVSKEKMPSVIQSVNAAIIPLKKIELFKGAIPSKIFETLAMKKPILLGVEGEAKELFINTGKAGLAFIPENENDLAEKILQLYSSEKLALELGENGYRYIKENFSRDKVANDFWNFILE